MPAEEFLRPPRGALQEEDRTTDGYLAWGV